MARWTDEKIKNNYIDKNDPGLNDPALSKETRDKGHKLLRDYEEFAFALRDLLGGEDVDSPRVDAAQKSLWESAMHAMEEVLTSA